METKLLIVEDDLFLQGGLCELLRREGINPMDFKINARMSGNPPLSEGPLKGLRQVETLLHLIKRPAFAYA